MENSEFEISLNDRGLLLLSELVKTERLDQYDTNYWTSLYNWVREHNGFHLVLNTGVINRLSPSGWGYYSSKSYRDYYIRDAYSVVGNYY